MSDRYGYEFDTADPHLPAACAVRWTRDCRWILELGASGGHVTKRLREGGAHVTAIEFDPTAARSLEQVADAALEADLDALGSGHLDKLGPFDAVVATDVLEHLRDPSRILDLLSRYLVDDGILVVSLPNVAHVDARLALLSGHFRMTDVGLLDNTHLRFFTRESARDLLERNGFEIVDETHARVPIGATEQASLCDERFLHLRADLATEPDADTYQFVFRATKRGVPLARALTREREATERATSLESELETARAELADAVSALADLNQRYASESQSSQVRIVKLERALRNVLESRSFHAGLIAWRLLRRGGGPSPDIHIRRLLEEGDDGR